VSRLFFTTLTKLLDGNQRNLLNSPRKVWNFSYCSEHWSAHKWPGQKIVALVEATAPVCVERFVDYPQLGRFTLRDEGTFQVPLTIFPQKINIKVNRENCCYRKGLYNGLVAFVFSAHQVLQITKLIEHSTIDEIAEGVSNVSVSNA
jgi:hypothetical protein